MTPPQPAHDAAAPNEYRDATRCLHSGTSPDPTTGALTVPLIQSTSYAWPSLDRPPRITYARAGNGPAEALERRLAALERGADAVTFASGVAALDALFRSLPNGARIVAGNQIYGGTTRLLTKLHQDRLEVVFVDARDPRRLEDALATPAALVLVETPTNPTLDIVDLRAAASAAHAAGALLAVDNTFLTPLSQRPLGLGADLSIHSTTKYLDGHNLSLGGAIVVTEEHAGEGAREQGPLASRLRWIRKATGTLLAPFDAWLTFNGTQTLAVRVRQQWESASRLARRLQHHPALADVRFPGLATHPGHGIHRRQAAGDGGLVTIDLGTFEAAREFCGRLRLFHIAEHLGATQSLVTHPASMSHADLPPERRRADGIGDGLIRLSLGLEDPDDLEEDVLSALEPLAARLPEVVA